MSESSHRRKLSDADKKAPGGFFFLVLFLLSPQLACFTTASAFLRPITYSREESHKAISNFSFKVGLPMSAKNIH